MPLANVAGHITVTTAGTEVAGPDVQAQSFYLSAHPENTDTVWILGTGDSNGFPLKEGLVAALIITVKNLSDLEFDAEVSGEKICWLKIS